MSYLNVDIHFVYYCVVITVYTSHAEIVVKDTKNIHVPTTCNYVLSGLSDAFRLLHSAILREYQLFVLLRRLRGVREIANISFVTSVCPSTWNNSAPTGRIFMKLDI